MIKIYIGSDHAGYPLKNSIIEKFQDKYEFLDIGTYSEESCDYPDFGKKVALKVNSDKGALGIVICGSGIGISIAANRIKGIRCALCTSPEMAELSRLHNDSNVLAMGARIISKEYAFEIFKKWITTEFEGGRHNRRVKKLDS